MGSQPSRSAADDVRDILDSLRRIVRALRVGAAAAEKRAGLSAAQLFVLQQVQSDPGCSIATLSARTHTDPSSVSAVVRRLVDGELLARKASRDDARRAELTITPKGRVTLRKAPKPAQTRIVTRLAKMPASQRRALAEGLHEIVASLGAERERPHMFFEDEKARGGSHERP